MLGVISEYLCLCADIDTVPLGTKINQYQEWTSYHQVPALPVVDNHFQFMLTELNSQFLPQQDQETSKSQS